MEKTVREHELEGELRYDRARLEEFKRRYISARKGLEEIRAAYEAGDFDRVEAILAIHTAFTHPKVKRPRILGVPTSAELH